MSNIGFPGLGLSFTINKTAFTVFGLRVQWYALIIVVGILAALVYFLRRGTRTEGFSEDDLLNICILVIPISIIGARTVYVLTSLEKYTNFWDAFKIWEGGWPSTARSCSGWRQCCSTAGRSGFPHSNCWTRSHRR